MTTISTTSNHPTVRQQLVLQDRFSAASGDALLTGVQAVCRVPLDVRRVDERRNLNTRAFMSGYQGSPLGTIDLTMGPLSGLLARHGIDFQPGMNEALAATAVLGTQAVPKLGSPLDGVTGFWYGKAPGLDQALDPIRHGNLMGAHPSGGALLFCGDDPTAKSSTVPCGSETVLRAALVPTLVAADSQQVLDFGLHGVWMSRTSGAWVALKVSTNVADGYAVARFNAETFDPVLPLLEDGQAYHHVVNGHLGASIAEDMERNLHQVRLPLVLDYARSNGLNRIVRSSPSDKIGIIAAGEPYLEARQALTGMGLADDQALSSAGIRLLQIGLVWPLDPTIVAEFAAGLEEIMVIEDKGPFLEHLVKDALYNLAERPRVIGVSDENGRPLLPRFGGVDAAGITKALAPRILRRHDIPTVRERLDKVRAPTRQPVTLTVVPRTPYFCSGCPHNSSTKTPSGSLVGGGIGCHAMAILMEPDQVGAITGLTQMGGEGAQWIGQQRYVDADHIFQNLGDGTLAHSGLLAIRAGIAAGTNITYKILFNSTVAMTGGQDAVAAYTVPSLIATLASEGVKQIIVTSDHPQNYRRTKLSKLATVRDRSQLLAAQEELRRVSGTTVLIHDQACAAELRRKRKRGLVPEPATRVVINERICEGCGDCGKKSNCLSVFPVQTEFGRKTRIDQSSCNKDYSCLAGDCPSFMTVVPQPGHRRARNAITDLDGSALPPAVALFVPDGFTMRITGIGGTGVITIAQILATAGFLDGLYPQGLDQVGLSQKAGPVVSDVKFAADPRPLAPKMTTAECDLYLACDLVVGASANNLSVTERTRSVAVASTADVPTGSIIRNPETAFRDRDHLARAIDASTRAGDNIYLQAKSLTESLFDSDQFANMFLVGAAYQKGALPLSSESIERAIELNGVAAATNVQAFRRGRQAVADPDAVSRLAYSLTAESNSCPAAEIKGPAPLGTGGGATLDDVVELRTADLTAYQSDRYAQRYAALVERARKAEAATVPASTEFAVAVAHNLHKLMAYKDEYEVARLALDPTERAKVTDEFGPNARVAWRLHPPVLRALGMKNKLSLGHWFTPVFSTLHRVRRIRGTVIDPFGYAKVRRIERKLIDEYAIVITDISAALTRTNHDVAVQIAQTPEIVRGYEHIKLANVEVYESTLARLRETFAGN